MTTRLQLRVRVVERSPSPVADTEGQFMARMVQEAIDQSSIGEIHAAPVAVVVRPRRTEFLDLRGPSLAGMPLSRFVAGLTRSGSGEEEAPVAVGVAGRFRLRVAGKKGEPQTVPVGLAFLEWSDCRWWQWQVLLDGGGQAIEDGEMQRSAESGDPLPAGLGRWWSLARRTGVRVNVSAGPPLLRPHESPLVH